MSLKSKLTNIDKKIVNLSKRSFNKIKKMFLKYKHKKEIEKLIAELNAENKETIIFLNVVDWNIPLFQRPQHIAKYMATQGYNYIFFTGNIYDNVLTYEKKENGLYIVNACYLKEIIKALKVDEKFIHLYSTDMGTTNKVIDDYLSQGYKIFYEYIDEISAELYGNKIPRTALEKHQRILSDPSMYVVCTARKLYDEVFKVRGTENLRLVTNGVDYEHFSKAIEECPITDIVSKNKPVIGYFGAFASWFDYELVKTLAKERPEYEILLIGWDYDGSIKQSCLDQYKNISIVGPIQYTELPTYAKWFNVATIPFKINDITESTSPIKLFEYMALGKPIVTTAMPECKLYESVLIGENSLDFIQKIDQALEFQSNITYLELLKKEALDNTWQAKTKNIVELIKNVRNK